MHGLESLIHSIGLKLFLVKRVVSSEFGGKGVRICSFWLHSFAFSKLEHSKVSKTLFHYSNFWKKATFNIPKFGKSR